MLHQGLNRKGGLEPVMGSCANPYGVDLQGFQWKRVQTEKQRFHYQDHSRSNNESMCWIKPNQEAEWQERMSLGTRELSKHGTLWASSCLAASLVSLAIKQAVWGRLLVWLVTASFA